MTLKYNNAQILDNIYNIWVCDLYKDFKQRP